MSSGDEDRARILLRRAAFVSGTLAALGGCAPARPAEPAPGSSPVTIPEQTATEATTPPPPSKNPAEPVRGDTPSYDMPEGIGEQARENFQRLFDNMKRIHPILDAMEALVPERCSVLDSKCEDRWRQLAAKQNELKEIQTFMHTCPGKSEDAKLYAEREKEHLAHAGERQSKLAERIERALGGDGDRGRERWEKLQEEAYAAAPHPCLSFACRDW